MLCHLNRKFDDTLLDVIMPVLHNELKGGIDNNDKMREYKLSLAYGIMQKYFIHIRQKLGSKVMLLCYIPDIALL